MKSLFQVFKNGLEKTKTSLVRSIQSIVTGDKPWSEAMYADLEAALLRADLGVTVTEQLLADLRDRYARGKIATSTDILRVAGEDIETILQANRPPDDPLTPLPPTVILLIGVNGSGKTTTAAKLAYRWQKDGKKVMLAACDTFRAAAIDQLRHWGDRLQCPVIYGPHGSDAAAVAYDSAVAARKQEMDVLLVDTAGRQHTRKTLMDELAKISRTLGKAVAGSPHHVWLTVDASIGGNAAVQAREFSKIVPLTGLIITKLDGTGKGGSLVAIARELGQPVFFAGLGEGMDDLQPFQPGYFAKALFANDR